MHASFKKHVFWFKIVATAATAKATPRNADRRTSACDSVKSQYVDSVVLKGAWI